MRPKLCWFMMLLILSLSGAGCGSFLARRMAQAPNRYPSWFAPRARVVLEFGSRFLTNFPARFVEVGPPAARLRYRIIEPADYRLKTSATNWLERGRMHFKFAFGATMPGPQNAGTTAPRGTVVLLHGYGLSQSAMAPWALRLAQEGWRCVLVDLRGHGKSTGRRIYFGVQEARDLSQLLDALARDRQVVEPVAAMGESYGAALALRWKAAEPRVREVVAIAPYAELARAILNVRREYAGWVPEVCVKAGLKKLPSVLHVEPGALDTTTTLTRHPVAALFVAGDEDKVTPVADVRRLRTQAAMGSELLVVPHATHEALTYFFKDLLEPVLAWLAERHNAVSQLSGN